MKLHRKDWKFVPAEPDPDFNEEQARMVIKWTIDETDRLQAQKQKEFDNGLKERTDAVARFIERVKQGAGESDVKSYFGQKLLEHLSGKEARAMDDLTVVDQYGRVVRRKGDMYAYGKKK